MKKEFFDIIIKLMETNKDIYFLSVGLGWPRTDEIEKKFPNRFIQCEASEQTALDIAVGLAYEGKIPFVYTITPFLYRGFETIRTYISYENLPVKMVGAGRDDDYSKHDGYSHDAKDIKKVMGLFSNIECFYPETNEELLNTVEKMIGNNKPSFISLKR